MANNVLSIKDYSPKSSDIFFFDNNVWMFLFCPLGSYKPDKQKGYSTFLKDIKAARATVFINSLVLSEFVNTYLRLDFKLWKEKVKQYAADYKRDYIPTQRYKDAVNDVKDAIQEILSCSEKGSDNFTAISFDNVLGTLNAIDFNDSYYLELARINKWNIVTDDIDFQKLPHSITIITDK